MSAGLRRARDTALAATGALLAVCNAATVGALLLAHRWGMAALFWVGFSLTTNVALDAWSRLREARRA